MNFEIAPKESEIRANWEAACVYCFSLTIDGKTGWRLPTNDELNAIYKSKNDFRGHYYWSSTESNGNNAWARFMAHGSQFSAKKSSPGVYVRAIRDLKDY